MPFLKEIFCPEAKGAGKGPHPELPECRIVMSTAVEAAGIWLLTGESARESCRTPAGCREVLEALKEEILRAEREAARSGGGRARPGGGGSKCPPPVCRYVDKRFLSLQELKRRVTKLETLLPEGTADGGGARGARETAEAFLAALLAPTRREARRRKSAPLRIRLAAWLAPIAEAGRGFRGKGRWKACPSYADTAAALDVCVDSISRAFRELEGDPACPYAFTSGNTGENGARQKMIALKKWLLFDRRPLHFDKEGRSRHLRPSFRGGVEPFELPERRTPEPSPAPPAEASSEEGGNSEKCLSDSIRLSPAVHANPPEGTPSPPPRPPARRAPPPRGLSGEGKRRLERAAWRAAREAKADGELFWDNSKVFMPVASLKTLIFGAFLMGFDWETQVRPALLRAIRHAHAAACLSGTPIRNPGAFAAAVFRRELARLPAPAPRSPNERFSRHASGKTPVSAPPAEDSYGQEKAEVFPSSPFSFAEAKAALLRLLSPEKAPPPPPALGSPEHTAARTRAMARLRLWAAEHVSALESFAPDHMSRLLAVRLQEMLGEELRPPATD